MKKRSYGSILFILLMILFSADIYQSENDTDFQWSTTLSFSEESGKTAELVFGESFNGSNGVDSYDIPLPGQPPGSGFIRTYFTTDMSPPYETLMREIKLYSLANQYKQWNFTVQWIPYDMDEGTWMTIHWNPDSFLTASYDSIVLHRKGHINGTWYTISDMRTENSISWYHEYLPAYPPYPEIWFLTDTFTIVCTKHNSPPQTPEKPAGETEGYYGTLYNYSTLSYDEEGDHLYYQIDWGDSSESLWLGPYNHNETMTFNHLWTKPGYYSIKMKAKDGSGAESEWSTPLFIQMDNRPPFIPNNPFPPHTATNIEKHIQITWSGGDPDTGDMLRYDVYFDSTNPPQKIISNQSTTSFSPLLFPTTTYYWQIVSFDEFGLFSSSPLWSFTTKDFTEENTDTGNLHPNANITVSSHTTYPNTNIIFDASESNDPDGYITEWCWDFGDENQSYGEITTYSYAKPGTFQVRLTIRDNKDSTDTATLSILVQTANNPPSKPTIGINHIDIMNKTYEFTISSTDRDNDTIQYHVQWGDGTNSTSMFLVQETPYKIQHTWRSAELYTITITASDTYSVSPSTTIYLLINGVYMDHHGYLLDNNDNGFFDTFFSNLTQEKSSVTYENEIYYFDTDGDGCWDYKYDKKTATIYLIDDKLQTIGFLPIIVILIVTVTSIIIFKKYMKK